MKARYDYGLVIFILTFSLISVSSYRENGEVLEMAHHRLTTIIVGSFTAIVICICIRPVWIGENLNNLVANNIEKLGKSLEGISLSLSLSLSLSVSLCLSLYIYNSFLFYLGETSDTLPELPPIYNYPPI
jgi:hypothetical protein